MSADINERVKIGRESADRIMVPGARVHTFIGGGSLLVGCDWDREQVLKLADAGLCELAGPSAFGIKHGIVVFDKGRATFVATKPDWNGTDL